MAVVGSARRDTPFWLAKPSRYAALSPAAARWTLGALAALLLVTLLALATPDPTARPAVAGSGDLALYAGVVEAVRHGGDYYAVTADALRLGGYPLRPFVTFRLPTLATVEATLPATVIATLLYTLALATMLAWYDRLRAGLRAAVPRAAVALLFAAGSLACWQVALAPFHEVWAGLLLALSLARWSPGRTAEAIGWGLAAALIRETAALYLVVMGAAALADGARREAAGWAAAMLALLLALAAHAHAVAQVVGPLDPASPGWLGLLGPGFAVRTAWLSSGLLLLPLGFAAPLIGLAWWGWTAWADALGARVAATIATYALLLGVAARLDTFYWGLLVTPVLLIGLVFVPDAIRTLANRALDTRRITVRRVTP